MPLTQTGEKAAGSNTWLCWAASARVCYAATSPIATGTGHSFPHSPASGSFHGSFSNLKPTKVAHAHSGSLLALTWMTNLYEAHIWLEPSVGGHGNSRFRAGNGRNASHGGP